jgi:hypothetical protein
MMLLLTVLASFGMFIAILLVGVAIGYALGYKNEKTLKQQVAKLRGVVKSHNKSAQLRELTMTELKQRDDWDFRNKLAELTGVPPITPDQERNVDPNSISNTF